VTDDLRRDLVERLVAHCRHLSVTGQEGTLADELEQHFRTAGEVVVRVGDSLVVGEPDGRRPTVALVGHLDVVPPTDDDRDVRVAVHDGDDVVIGRGTSDMKAGNVIAMAAFEDEQLRADSPYAMVLVLYAREEGAADDNELADVLAEVTWLGGVDLAIVLEPTDGEVQVGCLGVINATLSFHGKQAHAARPWHGDNALTKAGRFLTEVHDWPAVAVDVDSVRYFDTMAITQGWTDNPRNVVPALFRLNVNFRFAPTRGLDAAEAELRTLIGDRADVEIVDRALPAPPRLDAELVQRFIHATAATVTAKQAWTDLARFAALEVAAVNFGPGLTSQAHQRGEYVPVDALVDGHHRLVAFLRG